MVSRFLMIALCCIGQASDDEPIVVPEMVLVGSGRFEMGCTQEQQDHCMSDEKPVHMVHLKGFWIGKYEITNEQFAQFLSDAGNKIEDGEHWYKLDKYRLIDVSDGVFRSRMGFERHPVTNVSWYGARSYARWLSHKTNQRFRLPTEAEWEYAARGGNSSFLYSGSNSIDNVGWSSANSAGSGTGWGFKKDKGVHRVGTKRPNELGLFDMSGNVKEWCADLYTNRLMGGENPAGAEFGSGRVLRGGSWDNKPSECRVAARNFDHAVATYAVNKGFRVARERR